LGAVTVASGETEIEEQFPDWGIWQSDTGRWWASRRGALSAGQRRAGCVPYLRADDPDGLIEKLNEQENKLSDVGEELS
jgi:hypothetical protein